ARSTRPGATPRSRWRLLPTSRSPSSSPRALADEDRGGFAGDRDRFFGQQQGGGRAWAGWGLPEPARPSAPPEEVRRLRRRLAVLLVLLQGSYLVHGMPLAWGRHA